MASIRFAEGQQRSGSMGGSVYSHNRYGQYIRSRSIPVNPNTDRQVAVRNLIQTLTIVWQTVLTQDLRDAWETYAANVTWKNRFGDDVLLTGLNHYVRSNVPRMQCEIARLDTAPVVFTLAAAELELAVTASEATQQLTVAYDDGHAWCSETGAFEHISMGIPQNAAIKYFGGPYRHMCCVLGEDVVKRPASEDKKSEKSQTPPPTKGTRAPPVSPEVCDAQWPIAEGQRIWVRTRIGRADGRLSEFALVNFLCAA